MQAGGSGKIQLIEDIFEILDKDPDGKKFDKVSRIIGRSDLYEMDLILDINVDIFPVEVGQKLQLCLATTLNLDGAPDTRQYDPSLYHRESLMDGYDYVMHGKVFRFKDKTDKGIAKVDVYISFGGLLMQLTGDPKRLEELDLDQGIYILLRRV